MVILSDYLLSTESRPGSIVRLSSPQTEFLRSTGAVQTVLEVPGEHVPLHVPRHDPLAVHGDAPDLQTTVQNVQFLVANRNSRNIIFILYIIWLDLIQYIV